MPRLRVGLFILFLVLALLGAIKTEAGAEEISLAFESQGEASELSLGFAQEAFILDYRLSLSRPQSGFKGIGLGLLLPLGPIRRLGLELQPYLMAQPGRGLTAGLFGERLELSGLALLSVLTDLAFSTSGAMFFIKGEYAVGNIGLRGHLQLDWGELAVQPWTGRTREPYFPEWALTTASSRRPGYFPNSSLYMEIRRRFSETLTLSEGFTTPLGSSRIAPGLLLNAELGSFALRLLRQFPQATEAGYTLISVGFRQGVLYTPEQKRAAIAQGDLNFRFYPDHLEVDLLSSYSTAEFALQSESHLTPKGFSYSLGFSFSF